MRNHILLFSLILFAISLIVENNTVAADDSVVLLLKKTDSGYDIDKVPIRKDQTLHLDGNNEKGIIEIILPTGPGGSGNLVQKGLINGFYVHFDGRTITIESELSGGRRQSLPPQKLDDLKLYETHLSVTGGDGTSARFIISNYESIRVDTVGPLMDMFGGQVPMNPGDYSLFLNTERVDREQNLTGQMSLTYSGEYLFTEVVSPTGKKGNFVVDLGASNSVIRKDFLPDSTETSELFMMEYSPGGTRKLKYAPDGATGPIESIIGTATVENLTAGGLRFNRAVFNVMDALPVIRGKQLDGIIGLDLLHAARYLTLKYHTESGAASLVLSNEIPIENIDVELPYVSIRKSIFVRGQIDSRDVLFLVDSGSPDCMLQPAATRSLQSVVAHDSVYTYQGGGGQNEQGTLATIKSMSLGGNSFENVPCTIGNVFVLSTLGSGQLGGIIGNSLLSRFSGVTIDFKDHKIGLAL